MTESDGILTVWRKILRKIAFSGTTETLPDGRIVPKTDGGNGKFESDIDMSLSNGSIGADAPAATFGKTAALEDV